MCTCTYKYTVDLPGVYTCMYTCMDLQLAICSCLHVQYLYIYMFTYVHVGRYTYVDSQVIFFCCSFSSGLCSLPSSKEPQWHEKLRPQDNLSPQLLLAHKSHVTLRKTGKIHVCMYSQAECVTLALFLLLNYMYMRLVHRLTCKQCINTLNNKHYLMWYSEYSLCTT